jgi:putative transcriptional regulator
MENQIQVHDLTSALEQVEQYKKGKTSGFVVLNFEDPVNVKDIRENCQMTQDEFSKNFGVSLSTIQNWEQGRRTPEGPAKLLLKMIMAKPQLIKELIASFNKDPKHVHG